MPGAALPTLAAIVHCRSRDSGLASATLLGSRLRSSCAAPPMLANFHHRAPLAPPAGKMANAFRQETGCPILVHRD